MMSDQINDRIVPMRLQKFLARSGVASRRGSENLMTAGRVSVNGRVVVELGSKVDPLVDEVRVDGIVVCLATGATTLMLHKPSGVMTTMSDPQGRPTVAELVPLKQYPGLFPIGRLDFDTTGLLLFSTDGELGHGLLHPRRHVMKCYLALIEGRPTPGQLEALRGGIELDDGMTLPALVELLDGDEAASALAQVDAINAAASMIPRKKTAILKPRMSDNAVVCIHIREGRKRQVRRMFGAIGHPVLALHRASFGHVELGDLPRGEWRVLDAGEVDSLVQAASR